MIGGSGLRGRLLAAAGDGRPAMDKVASMDDEVSLNFAKLDGLLPVVVQEAGSGEVLMVAFMDREAWEATLATGEAHYYSRTRRQLWRKGGTSGHVQKVREIFVDCDEDTVLLKVEQVGGAACHTGHRSCFYRRRTAAGWEVMGTPVFDPKQVYG